MEVKCWEVFAKALQSNAPRGVDSGRPFFATAYHMPVCRSPDNLAGSKRTPNGGKRGARREIARRREIASANYRSTRS